MSLYLTSLSPSKTIKLEDITLKQTKDTFIDYIIENKAEKANLEGIENHLTQTEVTLKSKLDAIDILLQQKQDEYNKIVFIINSILQNNYNFTLSKHSNVNDNDHLIAQTKEMILIKEHDLLIYSQMKNRVKDININIKHRIEAEFQYHNKIQSQHSSFGIINKLITRDYFRQEQMYKSLDKEMKNNQRLYQTKYELKNQRFEIARMKLEQKKEDLEKAKVKFDTLLHQIKTVRKEYLNVMQYNTRLVKECWQYKREYYKNKAKIIKINSILGTRKTSELVRTVNKDQFHRNQMLNEFIYLNQNISKNTDITIKCDLSIKSIERNIMNKNCNQFYLSNEYSDKRVLNNEMNKTRKVFSNSQMQTQCIMKEAMMEGIVNRLLNIKKKLSVYFIYKADFNGNNNPIGFSNKFAMNRPLNDLIRDFTLKAKKILNLFQALASNMIDISYHSLNTIALLNYQYTRNHTQLIISFFDEQFSHLIDNQLEMKSSIMPKPTLSNVKKSFVKGNNYPNSAINIINNNNNIPTSLPLSAKSNIKFSNDLLANFKEYLTIRKGNNIKEYINQYPKQIITAISPFYWDLSNNDITLASSFSLKNITSASTRTIGFKKRMAYDPLQYKRNINQDNSKYLTHSLFKSENECNENSFDESNRNSLLKQEITTNADKSKIRYQDESERGKINLRIKQLFKFELEHNKQRNRNNQLIQSYHESHMKSNSTRFINVRSAYSIKHLNDYLREKQGITSALPHRRKMGFNSAYKCSSLHSHIDSKAATQSKFYSSKNPPSNKTKSLDFLYSKNHNKPHYRNNKIDVFIQKRCSN